MSGSSSPGPWGEEYTIDFSAAGVAAPPEEPPPRRRWLGLPPGRANLVLAYAAIAIALTAAAVTIVKSSSLHRPVAEAVVTEFLEAVHDGDIEKALSLTDTTDPAVAFLRPEALDSRWSIVTVAQVEYEPTDDEDRFVSHVYAEIEAYEGTRVGFRYLVGVENGRAVIDYGLFGTEVYTALDHLDVNGVSVPVDPDLGATTILLLPGLYEFYPDLPSTMEFDEESRVLALGDQYLPLGESRADTWLPVPWPQVSPEGEAVIDAALQDHFDACAANPSLADCPFAFPEDSSGTVTIAPGAVWEIAAYPQIQTEWWWFEPYQGFGLTTAVPGEARVRVQITEDGEERTATVGCPIWVDGLFAFLDFEGGVAINPGLEALEERCRSLVEVG